MGFESCSVADLRKLLVDNGIYSREDVEKIKGKANLVFELKQNGIGPPEEETVENIADEFVLEPEESHFVQAEEPTIVTNTDEEQIFPSNPKWKEYVLGFFEPSEVFEVGGNKYPSVGGLRRVAEILLGDIVFSGPVDHKITHPDSYNQLGACSIIYEIQILWKLGLPDYLTTNDVVPTKIFRGIAGANKNNIDDEFALYPEAIAETRAEARALRKALSLNVVSYEEITQKKVTDIVKEPEKPIVPDWQPTDGISENQKNTITVKCDQMGIDVFKFINSGKNGQKFNSLEEVTKEIAAAMIQRLSEYQQTNDTSRAIPDNIKKG